MRGIEAMAAQDLFDAIKGK
jgi:Kinesin motor domain